MRKRRLSVQGDDLLPEKNMKERAQYSVILQQKVLPEPGEKGFAARHFAFRTSNRQHFLGI